MRPFAFVFSRLILLVALALSGGALAYSGADYNWFPENSPLSSGAQIVYNSTNNACRFKTKTERYGSQYVAVSIFPAGSNAITYFWTDNPAKGYVADNATLKVAPLQSAGASVVAGASSAVGA